MLRRAAAFLIVCVAVAALLYGAAVAWATFTSHPFTIGGLPPLPFPSIQPPGGGPGSGSPPALPGQGPPGAPTPVAATQQPQPPGPQPSSKSCSGMTVTSFRLTTKAIRQETVDWSSTGGCAPYGGLISWSGQGIQSGQVPVTTSAGTTVVTISAPPCSPPPSNTATANVTFKIVLGDAAGHRAESALVAQVVLC